MRLIFMGPPGVGKGTQASRVKDHFDILHLSTGEILRDEISSGTVLGLKAMKFMDKGKLVPDALLLEMMEHRLQEDDCSNGFLLDGFPRTIPQADGLNLILDKINSKLDAVVSLKADQEELVRRLVLRGKESGRSDDTPEVIRLRQKVYWKQTAPLLDYYHEKDLLVEVDGMGEINDITLRIIKALG